MVSFVKLVACDQGGYETTHAAELVISGPSEQVLESLWSLAGGNDITQDLNQIQT